MQEVQIIGKEQEKSYRLEIIENPEQRRTQVTDACSWITCQFEYHRCMAKETYAKDKPTGVIRLNRRWLSEFL